MPECYICTDCIHRKVCSIYEQYDNIIKCDKKEKRLNPSTIPDMSMQELIAEVSKIDSNVETSQSIYVIEECAELIDELSKLIKALTKEARTDASVNLYPLFDEACDVLTTVFVMLYSRGFDEKAVEEQIKAKCKRTILNHIFDKK